MADCHSSFPSNGKADPKNKRGFRNSEFSWFQFPSNGKADPKRNKRPRFRVKPPKFQFPSNGKADPKGSKNFPAGTTASVRVSIPFKRESGSKGRRGNHLTVNPCRVSIPFKRESGSKEKYELRILVGGNVSIPFKRESGSKAERS